MARLSADTIMSAYYAALPSDTAVMSEEAKEAARAAASIVAASLLREIRNQQLAFSVAAERRATAAETELEQLTGCADEPQVVDMEDPKALFTDIEPSAEMMNRRLP